VPVSLINAYTDMGIEILQVYGLTETAGPACIITSEDAADHVGSTGRAFLMTDVRVVDEDGNDCPNGEHGEVLVRGDHIMVGYWNRPKATAETIVDGWLHTGDIATMDADGFVTIVDRLKDMLISGGENVYPAEIENVLAAHPDVVDVAVIGIPDEKWGEAVMAVVVRREGATVTDGDLVAFARESLAGYKVPKGIVFTDVLPRNPSGKLLKREIRAPYWEGHERQIS
jgi:acyl-CoA synthetase (AMP-forming)/AMP-acid ligase II